MSNQIKQILSLMIKKFKLSLDASVGDNKNTKRRQKQSLYDNALLISKVIDDFNPKSVDGCLQSSINNFEKALKNNLNEPLQFSFNSHRKHSIQVNNSKIKRTLENQMLTPRDEMKKSLITLKQDSIGQKEKNIRSIRQIGQRSGGNSFLTYRIDNHKRRIVFGNSKGSKETLPLNQFDSADGQYQMKAAFKTQNVKFFDSK